MDKLVVPLLDKNSLESKISGHFGRAPYLGVVNLEKSEIKETQIIANTSEHFGGRGKAAMNILELNPNAVVLLSCGPGAITAFQSKKIAVLTGKIETFNDAIKGYIEDNLTELTEGCKTSHNH
ncbi:MAG: NifB/NifX family molybdenum-iron cluster-binding protein [Candidatus Ranarchaeia archaeon]